MRYRWRRPTVVGDLVLGGRPFWMMRKELDPGTCRAGKDNDGDSRRGRRRLMDAQNEVLETIEQAKEVMTVRRVFGDPYEKNGSR